LLRLLWAAGWSRADPSGWGRRLGL